MKIKMAGCILLALAAVMAAGCQSSTQGYSGQSASGQSVAEEKVGIPMAEHNRVKINVQPFTIQWDPSEASKSFQEELPRSFTMKELNGNEK